MLRPREKAPAAPGVLPLPAEITNCNRMPRPAPRSGHSTLVARSSAGTSFAAVRSGLGEWGALDEHPRPARPDRGGRQDNTDHLGRDHAGDRGADYLGDLRVRLLLPRLEQPR